MNETILQSKHDHGDSEVVMRLADVEMSSVSRVLSRYGLSLRTIESGCEIPGSYWDQNHC